MKQDFDSWLDAKRLLIKDHLRLSMRRLESETPPALWEAMTYSLLAPGKRLRPLLVILTAEACGGNDQAALPACSAVEMVHTYSLIHDDLPAMDDDDLRRGLPTCHKKFGEAMAILAGDALLTEAFALLAQSYRPETAAACCLELAVGAGATGMVGGQVDDLAMEKQGGTLAELESLHRRKTGALFTACLRMGQSVAEEQTGAKISYDKREALEIYGNRLGLLFQITDDLVDVESTEDHAGKRVQKDATRGKLTYPGILGKAKTCQLAQRLCREAQDSLAPFGSGGELLMELSERVLNRNK